MHALSTPKLLALLCFGTMLAVACSSGGGSGGGVVDITPADVSGLWSSVVTNAGVATFSGCTGDLVPLNGLTFAVVQGAGAICVTQDAPLVTQFDDVFTLPAQTFNCNDGSSYIAAGGGTVTGDFFTGTIDSIFSTGITEKDFFTGTVQSSDALTILEYRVTLAGSLQGSCNLNPDLAIAVAVFATAAVPTAESTAAIGHRSAASLAAAAVHFARSRNR